MPPAAFLSIALLLTLYGGAWSLPRAADLCQLRPLSCNDQSPSKNLTTTFDNVLVVVAHPDDAEDTSGGLIRKLVLQGATVRYAVLTSGDKGTQNRSMSGDEIAAIRRQEQLNAAAVLGVKSVDFFGVPDGDLVNCDDARRNLTRLIRMYKPDLVITWNPVEKVELYLHGVQHSDHRAAGAIALQCSYPTARDWLFYPEQILNEGLDTWKVKQLYLINYEFDVMNPFANVAVDISNVIDTKIKALLQHKSQVGDPAAVAKSVKTTASALGAPVGMEYAEWYTRVLMMP